MFFRNKNSNAREAKAFQAQLDNANQAAEIDAAPIKDVNINAETEARISDAEAKIALYEEVLRGTEYPEERDMLIKYMKSLKAELKG